MVAVQNSTRPGLGWADSEWTPVREQGGLADPSSSEEEQQTRAVRVVEGLQGTQFAPSVDKSCADKELVQLL